MRSNWSNRMKRAAVITVALALSACSTYSGQKLGPGVEPKGIPYNMVKPEYSFSRTPPAAGAKKPTYALTVSYVPDLSQTYSLRVDPGIFTNPEFTMKFASGGTLQSTTATFTEQVTPTITAIGSFATNLVGVIATGLLDKDSIRAQIKGAMSDAACGERSDVPRIKAETTEERKVRDELTERINAFKDDDTFAKQFHYVTERERVCLAAALKALNDLLATAKPQIEAWEKERKAYLAAHPDDAPFVDSLTDAVNSQDTKALEKIAAEIASKADPQTDALPEPEKSRDALFRVASPAATAISQTTAQKQLEAVVKADPATWRARHLLYLEREIDRISLAPLRLKDADTSDVDDHLRKLRKARAVTLDVLPLHERALLLTKFLDSVKDKSGLAGKAPATAEFATARAELDAVLTQIETRRARVIADATPPDPPALPPLQDQRVERVKNEDITASKATGWAKGVGAKAPDYVLVLEEVK